MPTRRPSAAGGGGAGGGRAGVLGVVVVDPRPTARHGIVSVLTTAGVRVLDERPTLDGWSRRERSRNAPDAIVVGVAPGTSAPLRSPGEVPMLVVLADDSVASARAAMDAGVAGVVPASVTGDELAAALVDVAAGLTHVHPSMLAGLVDRLRSTAAANDQRALSQRERAVTVLVAEGLTNAAIARELSVAESTVKTHLAHVLDKLGARDRAHAVAIALRTGLID